MHFLDNFFSFKNYCCCSSTTQDRPHVSIASSLPPQEHTEMKRLSHLFSYFPRPRCLIYSSLLEPLTPPSLSSLSQKLCFLQIKKIGLSQTIDYIQAFI